MNYAVVEIGSSQFRVEKGDVIKADLKLGQSKKNIKVGKVLMCHLGKRFEFGGPYVKGASVILDVIGEGRERKVVAYKYKRRKSTKFKKGHRQRSITLKVREIEA